MARRKTEAEEPKKRKKYNSFFSDLIVLLFVGVGCFYLGVYREPVGAFIHRTTPVVVQAFIATGEKIKEGFFYVAPRIQSTLGNVIDKLKNTKDEKSPAQQNQKQDKLVESTKTKK